MVRIAEQVLVSEEHGGAQLHKPEVAPSPHPFPPASFATAITSKDGLRMPQTIAHRGFKAKFPENSMAAFRGAVEAGTHAIETDIHLTKDNEVVLSHDPTLKRCFGMPTKIIDLEWNYVKTLRTTAEPHEPMPRLAELLKYVTQPGREHLWILLDIKLSNNADDVMRLISDVLKSMPPAKGRPWPERIVLGCWATKFIPLCDKYLPGYPIATIGFATSYSKQYFDVPNASFNMLQSSIMGPLNASFLHKVKALKRPVFSWVVNDEKKMRWGIKKELDGVITDDPKLFLEVCEKWDTTSESPKFGVMDILFILRQHILIAVFLSFFLWKHGTGVDPKFTYRGMEETKKRN